MNIRSHLRTATRECHQRLDSCMGELGLFESSKGYRNYLRCMLEMQVEFAESLERVERASGLSARATSIENCILADLESVGSLPSNFQVSSSPNRISEARGATSADWGRSYVVEGSALGGRYLLATAKERLPAGTTTRFLNQLSEDAQYRWPKFVAALDSQTFISLDEATEASVEVFAFVERRVKLILHSLHGSSSQ